MFDLEMEVASFIFRKVIRRRMTKEERRDFHLKVEPRILVK
jgi:hypothetical protein